LSPPSELCSQVTVIIPAYNEAPRIEAVLSPLRRTPDLAAIIVVDDASTDQTPVVVERFSALDSRVHLLRLPANRGKGAAMVTGALYSPTDVVLFLDADLIGLQPEHIAALTKPVLAGRCDMTVGIFRHGRVQLDLAQRLTPFLSGQRCLRWSLFARTPDLDQAGWGVETAFHLYAGLHDLRIEKVWLEGLSQWMKEEKEGLPRGMRERARMYGHIVRYAFLFLLGSLLSYEGMRRWRRGRR